MEVYRAREVYGASPHDWLGVSSFFALPYSFGHPWAFLAAADRWRAADRAERADVGEAAGRDERARQERLLDAGLEETFPASDPVAVMRLT